MAKILIVGCGDLGAELARLLVSDGHLVTGVRVSEKPGPLHIRLIQADVTHLDSLQSLSHIQAEILIYCVAANAQTDESYRMHYVEGLQNVLRTQAHNNHLKHIFFVSSTRVYGQVTDNLLDELTPAEPCDFGGERLLEAEQLLSTMDCDTTKIRLAGIYGAGRQYLIKMAKEPSRWPESNKWTNRIHRDDAARFISFLCEKVVTGETIQDCYIGVDDMPTLQYDVLKWIADQIGVVSTPMPADEKISGKRLSNQRLRSTGFQLKYSNYQIGYSEMLNDI